MKKLSRSGRVYLDDIDINRKMIEDGYAWVYSQYCKIPERVKWEQLQEIAKSDKKGLWQADNPTPPCNGAKIHNPYTNI
ncbi:MAG: thermonuclease family protein [Endomicrobium sp.]|jgi:endonuclease YncB( thermonuclease family)|nr:thermonuclease family protein [Endomicrobium sp.]